MSQKAELLKVMQQAIDSQAPLVYEKAIIILSEMIDTEYLNKPQVITLSGVMKAIKSLIPKKSIENSSYAQARHISAMGVLVYLDK